MEKTTRLIHRAKVNNNCPECFSVEGLEFSFYQEETDNKLFSKASKDLVEVLHCSNCDQDIYPVKWSDDIERVYEYQRKLAKPESTGIKLKPLAYILILIDTLILAGLIYYFNN